MHYVIKVEISWSGSMSWKHEGGLLVLKWTLYLVMDVDDLALRSLTHNLQTLRIKDVLGENVRMIISYLKGVLLLLGNCQRMSTGVKGLLNNTFYSPVSDYFTDYMSAIYFSCCCCTQMITLLRR